MYRIASAAIVFAATTTIAAAGWASTPSDQDDGDHLTPDTMRATATAATPDAALDAAEDALIGQIGTYCRVTGMGAPEVLEVMSWASIGEASSDAEAVGTFFCGEADSDGDGLSDAAEQAGWTILVDAATGEERHVTSDPFEADSDDDGIEDSDERRLMSDPENHDTDGDGLTDFEELRPYVGC